MEYFMTVQVINFPAEGGGEVRLKVALIIIVIALLITAANFGASLGLTRSSLVETASKDILLALDIANDLVSTRIRLYESSAQKVAERLIRTESLYELEETMREQLAEYPEFLSVAILDQRGVVAWVDHIPLPINWLYASGYIQTAFDGRTIISTTRHSDYLRDLVMYICTPLEEDRVLVVTISGMTFSELLGDYVLWNTGSIFMIDEEDILIAYVDTEPVAARVSIMELLIPTNPQDTRDILSELLLEDGGLGHYMYNGAEYYCASDRVFAEGGIKWRIGLTVPLSESPVARVQNRLTLLAIVFMAASIVVAYIASIYLAKPFNRIASQNRRLEELNTETLRLQSELEAALEVAQQANHTKSRFIASISHEMRTPLNAVIGLSEILLASGVVQDEAEANLGTIHASGVTLLGIVNDILDISKIESGRFDLSLTEYDVPSLINDIMSLNTVRIGSKPIKFKLNVDEGLPSRLYGDDLRVKQIFNNLLSNAFKYTISGSVEWDISVERDGYDIWLVSHVRDTGVGIKPEDIPKLFEDYTQVDTNKNRQTEGTGLGLSITKRFLNMMNGSISVESEYGQGSTFTVRILQQYVSDDCIGKAAADNLMSSEISTIRRYQNTTLKRIDLSYTHVLVVDDMPANLDVARGMLATYRINVDCASSGGQAVEMIRIGEPRYDAVFMDHMMSGMDGIEAARVIREEIGTDYARNVPIIALTANAAAGNEAMFLQNGFQAFVSKPIDVMLLDSVLRKWVRNKDRERERDEERGYSTPSGYDFYPGNDNAPLGGMIIEGIDMAAGLERFGNSGEAYAKVLLSYTVNTRPLLGDMGLFLAAEDMAEYAIVVHGIKGSSYGMGAKVAGEGAERLERLAEAGDTVSVSAEHEPYIEYMEALLNSIDSALEVYFSKNKKPTATAPNPLLLQELREACAEYDAGRVDNAIAQLESHEYESGAELVAWLRGQVEDMNYDVIAGGDWEEK